MASSSRRDNGGNGRIRNAAQTLYSDNQSLIAEIRKFISVMKGIAVDLEKDNQSELVKKLEDGVVELLETSDDCAHFSSVVESVGNNYQPQEDDELTDFKKLFEDEVLKLKASSSSAPQNHPLLRQFKEAIWHVHHAGQPMPGEEQEDIVMTTTQSNVLNVTCPLTGKPISELEDPVRSMDCKHIYDKKGVMQYMRTKTAVCVCPVAGCPKVLQVGRVLCDPLLRIEIEEMASISKETAQPTNVEDFTELDDDD